MFFLKSVSIITLDLALEGGSRSKVIMLTDLRRNIITQWQGTGNYSMLTTTEYSVMVLVSGFE